MYTCIAYDFQTAAVIPPHFLTIYIIREANIALKNPCYVMMSWRYYVVFHPVTEVGQRCSPITCPPCLLCLVGPCCVVIAVEQF